MSNFIIHVILDKSRTTRIVRFILIKSFKRGGGAPVNTMLSDLSNNDVVISDN